MVARLLAVFICLLVIARLLIITHLECIWAWQNNQTLHMQDLVMLAPVSPELAQH